MKKNLFLLIVLFSLQLQSQTYIKANALSTLLTIPNIGVETSIGEKSTLQFDVLASLWKSIDGKPYKLFTFISEYRYHFNEKYNGFYAGAHLGFDSYDVTKWGAYDALGVHSVGVGYVIGATIGYQKKLNDKFLLDFFLGGGNHQGFYNSYYIDTGKRWELDDSVGRNKSGEWLPYRGGIMISYKLN
jgi:hypothetical protein